MSSVQAIDRLREVYATDSSGSWLAELRESGWTHFRERGFPSTREEDWKYTSLRSLQNRSFIPPKEIPDIKAEALNKRGIAGLDAIQLRFLNGAFPGHTDTMGTVLPPGLRIMPLSRALEDNQALKKQLGQLVDLSTQAFAALNTAFLSDGVYVEIAEDVTLDKPIYLMFVSVAQRMSQRMSPGTASEEEPLMITPRILINLGRRSRATVIEHYISFGKVANFTNAVTEIRAGRQCSLEHYKLQEESRHGFHVGAIHMTQDAGSRIVSHNINVGGKLVRNDIHSRLDDIGAEVVLNGLSVENDRQHIDNHTRIDHLKPETRSEESYRSVLDGHSRGVFNGKVVVHEHAQRIQAHQSSDNLLLSDGAEIDTKPELEIYADDVKCSHGATVGQPNEDALFYLRSRGIDEDTANSLLTFAFADEVIAKVQLEPIRTHLEAIVLGRLPDHERIEEFV